MPKQQQLHSSLPSRVCRKEGNEVPASQSLGLGPNYNSLMINKPQSSPERCPCCREQVLQRVGSDFYCPHCREVQVVFEDDVRMVPSKYQSNSKNSRQLQTQRRLNALINEFAIKYRDLSADETSLFRHRLLALKGETPRKKGSREAAAVVVFMGMLAEIKLNIRQFCQKNLLNVRLFNQKYKVYQKLFRAHKASREEEEESSAVKQQQKMEESSPTEKSQAPSSAVPLLPRARHAVSTIFQFIFSKFIYRSRRGEIIEGLVERLQRADEQLLLRINYGEQSELKLYYLIFAVLKSLKHKITFLQYSAVIQRETGYSIKRKPAADIRKHYQLFLRQTPNHELESQLPSQQQQYSEGECKAEPLD